MKSILLVLTSTYLASCIPIPPPHPAVVAVRQEEELLPLYLKSSKIFNPHLQQILPLTSLLHYGEQPVIFLHFRVHVVAVIKLLPNIVILKKIINVYNHICLPMR